MFSIFYLGQYRIGNTMEVTKISFKMDLLSSGHIIITKKCNRFMECIVSVRHNSEGVLNTPS
jgi:hypothetical protein